ncbi:MSC_0882 family membrane protein [Mycoplasmopsis columbinasalis]|uniref:Uncharacterized protein n=1 Tax=Mycoplasmopsis columbinasalis TaxID=114880 RepID=A0A449BAW6_9BACT|nr:hypothetical protein [Mycoplasmopsis columbinasalis]VEU78338.1 Uncharacterised protein [Mycoplasmopsis columbinasalis]
MNDRNQRRFKSPDNNYQQTNYQNPQQYNQNYQQTPQPTFNPQYQQPVQPNYQPQYQQPIAPQYQPVPQPTFQPQYQQPQQPTFVQPQQMPPQAPAATQQVFPPQNLFNNQPQTQNVPSINMTNESLDRLQKTIKFEKTLTTIGLIIGLLIFLAGSIFFALAYTQTTSLFPKKEGHYNGYLILTGFVLFVGFAILLQNIFERKRWNSILRSAKRAKETSDVLNYSVAFNSMLKRLALKEVNIMWIVIFLVTYLGVFAGIVWGLYSSGQWFYESEVLKINFDWPKWLDNAFTSTRLLCWIIFGIICGLIGLFIIMKIFDKKRSQGFEMFLGADATAILANVSAEKRHRNKIWLWTYIIAVILTILLPLAILFFIGWRSIKRKKVVASK